MTNAEAIKYIESNYPNCNAYSGLREALDLAIAALREKAEKERRYVVVSTGHRWGVNEMPEDSAVACCIPTREAAQRIADIYEGVKP